MNFVEGYIYHLFNQGNNKRKIFFLRKNYLFFLKKIKTYILPFCDILAWCLMPNHFHLMILVNKVEIPIRELSDTMSQSHHITSNETEKSLKDLSHTMTPSHRMTGKFRSLNDSIAILLRSYTRAINKQENLSGSLFKAHTKAECINCPNGISPSWFFTHGITQIYVSDHEHEYLQVCFNYIHQNPVVAGLVSKVEDWEFSSAKEYRRKQSGKLVNKEKAAEYLVI